MRRKHRKSIQRYVQDQENQRFRHQIQSSYQYPYQPRYSSAPPQQSPPPTMQYESPPPYSTYLAPVHHQSPQYHYPTNLQQPQSYPPATHCNVYEAHQPTAYHAPPPPPPNYASHSNHCTMPSNHILQPAYAGSAPRPVFYC